MMGWAGRAAGRLLLAAALAMTAAAHMVSISTGEIRVEGTRGVYEIRMPLFEVQHMDDPAKALMGGMRFLAGGVEARRVTGACTRVEQENALVCKSEYEFAAPVDMLEAVSTLHHATVPQHVHVLRAVRGGFSDQAVLDLSFPRKELRFRPPTMMERAARESVAGAARAAGGAAQIVFLFGLVLAARSRRELFVLAGMFLLGEAAACVVLPWTAWQPAPRFVEAAAALTIAYLAVETLTLPEAGQRWAVAGVLGLFHGLYFALFIASGGFSAGWVLAGALIAEALLIAAIAWAWGRVAGPLERFRPVRAMSALLLVGGLAWFFWRLRE